MLWFWGVAGDTVLLGMLGFVRSRECSGVFGSRECCGFEDALVFLGAGNALVCWEQEMLGFVGSRGYCGFEDAGVC